MKLAVHQTAGVFRSPADNLARLRRAAGEAAGEGADLLVLPELWLTGYNLGDAVFELAEPADGPSAAAVAEIAAAAGIAVLYGYPEREGARIFNAALLIGRDGRRLANARKAHLFGSEEKLRFTPGDRDFALADLAGTRLGILICYDVEFSEAVRALALAGAQLIAVPTALMDPYGFIASRMVPVRAYENQLFIAYANRIGREGELTYCGSSCIVGPDGHDLARAGRDETLLVVEIDRAALAVQRSVFSYLDDRRPELYSALVVR